jgi:hypothetical protein
MSLPTETFLMQIYHHHHVLEGLGMFNADLNFLISPDKPLIPIGKQLNTLIPE